MTRSPPESRPAAQAARISMEPPMTPREQPLHRRCAGEDRAMNSATVRQQAIRAIAGAKYQLNHVDFKTTDIKDLYGANVFNEEVQRKRLPKPVFRSLQNTIKQGAPLDPAIADSVATAMKDWAMEQGATHFTHLLQPMTGLTAEKHDRFLQPSSA